MFFDDKDGNFKTDSLTGLYDRGVIVEYTNKLIKENIPFSLALVDIDNFKNVNDNYGHAAGDEIIKLVAEKLQNELKGTGIVGRFGGDEFLFVIENIVQYEALWKLCRVLFKKVDGFPIQGLPGCFITCTTGLSRFPLDGSTYSELMEKTDKALYRGKQKGRSCFIIYLDSKHKNIVLHSDQKAPDTAIQRITTMFKLLNMQKSLKEGILAVLNNFSSSMMIDHLAVQSNDKLLFSVVHPLSKIKDFSFVDRKLFELDVSNTAGIFAINERRQLAALKQTELFNELSKQSIKSTAYASIEYNGKIYGYLRADTTSHDRIWQNEDLELLVTAANAIATSLHYQNIELNDLV